MDEVAALIVDRDGWPHGLQCIDCGLKLQHGFPYSKRLVAMNGDVPIVEIVCSACAYNIVAPAQ